MKFFIIFLFFISAFANQKVSIILDWKYQFEFAGYIAAKEKGFYKEAGVDVRLVQYHNNNIVKDVLDGKYTFGIYDNYLINYKIEGKPVKLIASIFKRSALVLVVSPKIKTLKDLENKTIMIAYKDKNTFKDFLKNNNVDITKVHFVPTNYSIKPFIEKKVDGFSAFITDEPYLLEKKGIKFNIINPSDYNFLMYQGEFFTSKAFADNNPVLVNKIKKATIKGWQYALNHKKELVNIIYNKYSKRKSKEALFDEANKLHKKIDVDKVVNDYIFQFQNPLNLDAKYMILINLYNYYLQNKSTIYISLVFLLALIIFIYFYMKQLQQKKEIYTLFNKVPVGYILVDMEKKVILNTNKYMLELFKVKNKKLFENTKPFYINENDFKKFKLILENYSKKYKTLDGFDINWQYKKTTGELFWVNIKAIPYGRNKILWVFVDITNLIDIQNELKRVMKVKEEFLANMSHEIRTPLNAMLGFIDIISQTEQDKNNKEYLEIVKNSGNSLLTIINDILDFSKIQSGKFKIEKIKFYPKEEFQNLILLFGNKVKEKNINLEIIFENLDCYLESDPIRIKQVIANFLSNAIKFSHKNGEIICRIKYFDESEKLYVEVIDNGIGIDEKHLEHIFDAFTQADSSTTRKYGGTGLGLSISKKLIELLNGKLEVESEIGKGSKFCFYIPAKKINLDTPLKEEKIIEEIKFDAKILMVEDNKANQMFLKVILNRLGIKNIDIANDGLEAIQIASDEYDIIFMDENMPNMNGLEATKIIKHRGIKTPIVAITANSLSGDKSKFLEIMDDYLSKPVEKEKLIMILHKYIKKVQND